MFGCPGRYKRQIEADAEEFYEKYDEEMIEELLNQMRDELEGMKVDDIDEDLIEEIWINWKEKLPDRGKWAFEMANDRCIDAMEDRYEDYRDRQLLGE